jgi:hypothetical protein
MNALTVIAQNARQRLSEQASEKILFLSGKFPEVGKLSLRNTVPLSITRPRD